MTNAELARFIDEITDLTDRFAKAAAEETAKDIMVPVHMMGRRLAMLEAQAARRLPDTVKLKGRKPTRRPGGSAEPRQTASGP